MELNKLSLKKIDIKLFDPPDDIDPEQDTLRFEGKEKGALIFARGEGDYHSPDSIYFSYTSGGLNQKRSNLEVHSSDPKNETIELWYELLILIMVDIIGLSKE